MANIDEARAVYNTLCETLDKEKWKYEKEERKNEFYISLTAVGDDLKMSIIIHVDIERRVVYLKSPMPFSVPAARREVVGQALLRANWDMLNGSFETDLSDGYIAFKMVVPFMGSHLSVDTCHYLIFLSCEMVDKYNDKLLAVSQGNMTIDQFQKFIDNYNK